MEQETHGFFFDVLRHLIEHLITVHFVLYQRISLTISCQTDTLTQLIHIINVIHPLPVNHL